MKVIKISGVKIYSLIEEIENSQNEPGSTNPFISLP
jgi:hypothetical protein